MKSFPSQISESCIIHENLQAIRRETHEDAGKADLMSAQEQIPNERQGHG